MTACDMDRTCTTPATMIGSKGYAYCTYHGPIRRQSGYERVRKMTAAEQRAVDAGTPLTAY